MIMMKLIMIMMTMMILLIVTVLTPSMIASDPFSKETLDSFTSTCQVARNFDLRHESKRLREETVSSD
jgi:hypothetical protein